MNKKYGILVVFCPGDPINGQFPEVSSDKIYDLKLYDGGESRMRAAVIAARNADWIILVGGSENKVGAMKDYILCRSNDSFKQYLEEHIIRIESDSNTNGNLNAIKKAIEGVKNFEHITWFLSNQYHLERIKLFATKILGFEPVKESLLRAEDFYNSDLFDFKESKMSREKLEKMGCRDWNIGIYRDQYKSSEKFKCIIHDIVPYKTLIEK